MSRLETKENIIKVSMGIILNAGKAQDQITQAFAYIEEEDFERVQHCLEEASNYLNKAHLLQTETVQEESRGVNIEYSVLFTHAQDTLMTIKSEYLMVHRMKKIFEKLFSELREVRQNETTSR